MSTDQAAPREVATFGGGCFWCLEPIFADLKGVERVDSGYAGGTVAHPSYQQVCTGTTGHAEVVQVTFDPRTVSYQ
ncbi:MAG TPA: peptide-methionine (S)-S-oxide reductase, partial [Thermomicrobiales bacterium]|nr:peptide-methionine (S)-S-oxide reductase [Thermomicrobiales bacterium]